MVQQVRSEDYVPPLDIGPVSNQPAGVPFMEAFKATFAYQYSPLIDRVAEEARFGERSYDPSFDPFTEERRNGYEEYLNELARAKDEEHLAFIKQDIDARLQTKDTLEEAGFWSGGMWVASLVDPLNVAFAVPVWGQLGLMAKGGMTVRQAAAASARGGFATGLVTEAMRAPFDKTNTFTETGLNLAATTAVSTILGSAPSVARGAYNSAKKSQAMRNEIYRGKGTLPEKFGNYTIEYGNNDAPLLPISKSRQLQLDAIDERIASAKQRLDSPEATKAQKDRFLTELTQLRKSKSRMMKLAVREAGVDRTPAVVFNGKKIKIDENAASIEFDQRPWVKPEIEGAEPFREKDFLTPQEWTDFQIIRAQVRDEVSRGKGRPSKARNIAYVNKTNKIAYERMASQADLAETPFVNSAAYRMLTTPGKRIMKDGLDTMKRDYHLLAGVDMFRTTGVESGRNQHQSVARRADTHMGRSSAALRVLENLWAQDQLGRNLTTKVLGYNTDNIVARTEQKQTFEQWFETIVDSKLAHAGGRLDLSELSPQNQQAVKELDTFFKNYQLDLQDVGLLNTPERIRERAIEAREQGKEKLADFLDEIIKQGFEERYQFPIYYNKELLLKDEGKRAELVRVFADWIRTHPMKVVWDPVEDKFVPARSKSPEQIAEDAVNAILEEGDPITHLDLAEGPPKGKHLRHRMIDIPEHLIADFIIKEPRVLHSYATRVGRRMEFVRNFGHRSIDEILDDHEADMRAAGFSEKKIQGLRQDFLFDYERTMGEYNKSPDRLDAQAGAAIKAVAGMSYLDTAALASVTDIGNIVMERGPGQMFFSFKSELDKGLMQQAKKNVIFTGEAQELASGMVQRRIVADNIEGINPNMQQRFFDPIERAYYNIPVLGNGLGALTYYFKTVDGVYRSHDFMRIIKGIADNNVKEVDRQYLLRHGLTEQDARIIASYPHEMGDRYIFANREQWPASSPKERELLLKWDTAMNIGISNTILHATTFDKPRVMDGVIYTRHRPWMDRIGLKIDERASSKSIKVVRLETQLMTFPFQFFNFMLGATNRITAGMLDPMKQHRLVGAMALLGLGYTSLRLKKFGQDWWFDERSNAEVLQRSIDASGLFGVYGELAYIATHAAIGTGLLNPDDSLLRPKYNPEIDDVVTEPLGAGPGMIWAWLKAAKEYFDGDETEAAKQFGYNTPTTPLISFAQDWFQ